MSDTTPLSHRCSNCGAELPPADASGVAHCRFCRQEFRFELPPPTPLPVQPVSHHEHVQQININVVNAAPLRIQPAPRTSPFTMGCAIIISVLGFIFLVMVKASTNDQRQVVTSPPSRAAAPSPPPPKVVSPVQPSNPVVLPTKPPGPTATPPASPKRPVHRGSRAP